MSLTGTKYTATRVRGFAPWKPHAKTQAVLDDIQDVLTTLGAYWPLTCRQIGYRLLGYPGYAKTEAHFANVIEIVGRARRAGLIPWDAIRDDHIYRRGGDGFTGIDHFRESVKESAASYALDRQIGQPQHLEIWVEAAGMVPQVASMVDDWSVPVRSTQGFDSITAKQAIARTIALRDISTIIGVIGDHDAHGLAVIDSRSEDVEAFVDGFLTDYTKHGGDPLTGEVEFVWLATRPDQIDSLGLDSKPHSDSRRADGSIKQFVGDSTEAWDRTVQAEAINPPDLEAIVQKFVEDRFDDTILAKVKTREGKERTKAKRLVKDI